MPGRVLVLFSMTVSGFGLFRAGARQDHTAFDAPAWLIVAPRLLAAACKSMTRLCVSGIPQSAPTSKTTATKQEKRPKQIYRLNLF